MQTNRFLENMPLDNLTVIGPFRGPTGYGHHVREFTRELHNQGVAVELVDLPEWSPHPLPEHLRDPWFDSLRSPVSGPVVLHFCMPHQVVPRQARLNVNYTMFEATRICRLWVRQNRKHDLVIVPTESSYQAWIRSGVPAERVRISPLGINHVVFSGTAAPLEIHLENGEPLSRRRTRFLNVSAFDPRKNLLGLLRVWMKTTRASDDAVLVMKLGSYSRGRDELFRRYVAA